MDLLVSELVSNSVIHAGADRVELRADTSPERVHVEVSDPGPGFESTPRREPSYEGRGGFGLVIVDKVADRWGVSNDGSARVWFEIDHSSDRSARFARGLSRGEAEQISGFPS